MSHRDAAEPRALGRRDASDGVFDGHRAPFVAHPPELADPEEERRGIRLRGRRLLGAHDERDAVPRAHLRERELDLALESARHDADGTAGGAPRDQLDRAGEGAESPFEAVHEPRCLGGHQRAHLVFAERSTSAREDRAEDPRVVEAEVVLRVVGLADRDGVAREHVVERREMNGFAVDQDPVEIEQRRRRTRSHEAHSYLAVRSRSRDTMTARPKRASTACDAGE